MIPRHRTRRRFPARALASAIAFLLVALSGCGGRDASPMSPVAGEDPATPSAIAAPADASPGAAVPTDPVAAEAIDGVRPGYGTASWVRGQLVAEVSPGWSASRIDRVWGTTTLERIPGSPFALMRMPDGADYDVLARDLIARGACVTCSRNHYLEAPEAKQASIAFYEGDLTNADFADQDALSRVHAAAAHLRATGAGVTVAVLDTGIDATHPDLAERVRRDGWDFVDDDADPTDGIAGRDADYDGLYDEAAGHGTHVAGIVHAMAPDADLLAVRILDTEGIGTVFDLARGIRFADRKRADVINLSLGMDGVSPAVRWAVRRARANGRVLVGSAGNDGTFSNLHFPASLPEVVSVAALDAADGKAGFSNWGDVVELSAPGEGIVSTYLYNGYAVWSGTSMAAPFVSGAMAIVRELMPGASPAGLRDALRDAAQPLDHAGEAWDGLMGAGRVDLFSLVVSGSAEAP